MAETTDRESYENWVAAQGKKQPSVWVRATASPDWEATASHPLFDALGKATISRDALGRYLQQDYAFIDSFTALLGHAIGHAPRMDDRIVLGQFVGMLTSAENTFFQRAFEDLGLPTDPGRMPSPFAVTRDFRRLLDDTGRSGDYAEMLAVLVVTEGLYLDWAKRVTVSPSVSSIAREWIDLHHNPDFETFVQWLYERLDDIGHDLDAPRFGRMAARFRQAVRLERAFHDACWHG